MTNIINVILFSNFANKLTSQCLFMRIFGRILLTKYDLMYLILCIYYTVADPGFPIGGAPSHWGLGGAPTSDVGTFWQKRMQKRKYWILL